MNVNIGKYGFKKLNIYNTKQKGDQLNKWKKKSEAKKL